MSWRTTQRHPLIRTRQDSFDPGAAGPIGISVTRVLLVFAAAFESTVMSLLLSRKVFWGGNLMLNHVASTQESASVADWPVSDT